jgi:hypothetical protein
MSPSWQEVTRQVRERAGNRCEYCCMHQALQGATFHVEHIRPICEGGTDSLDNLAWACPGCNLSKSSRLHVADPSTGAIVPLFNPRTDRWSQHLRWVGHRLAGRTPIGRGLIAAFDLNHERRLRIRQAEEAFDLFPPRRKRKGG